MSESSNSNINNTTSTHYPELLQTITSRRKSAAWMLYHYQTPVSRKKESLCVSVSSSSPKSSRQKSPIRLGPRSPVKIIKSRIVREDVNEMNNSSCGSSYATRRTSLLSISTSSSDDSEIKRRNSAVVSALNDSGNSSMGSFLFQQGEFTTSERKTSPRLRHSSIKRPGSPSHRRSKSCNERPNTDMIDNGTGYDSTSTESEAFPSEVLLPGIIRVDSGDGIT